MIGFNRLEGYYECGQIDCAAALGWEKPFSAPGGRDNRLKRVVSDKAIKGNQSLLLGKIWLESACAWPGFDKFCAGLDILAHDIGGLLIALLHLGRAQVDDREAEERERQRLMGKREFDRDEREERRDAQRTWSTATAARTSGAARERRAGRGAKRGDGLNKREGDDA